MTTEVDVYGALQSSAGVVAIVGANGVHAGTVDQNTPMPYVVIEGAVSVNPETQLDGESAKDRKRFQVSSYSGNYEQAYALSHVVRSAMRTVRGIYLTEAYVTEDDGRTHRIIQDFAVWSNPNE